MKRVMCVWLPNWPLQRIRYEQPEPKTRTLVVYSDAGHRGLRVVTCSPTAVKRGVAPGMPLAEAKGILESIPPPGSEPLFMPHEPQADADALRSLAVWCQRFSPIVGVEEPDNLVLNLSGCSHLFGGERRLSQQLSQALEHWGFFTRTAIADTLGAAWAVAHFGKNRTAIVPPEEQRTALRSLPVESLRLPHTVCASLTELDIRRVGQLQLLPRADLASRFGPHPARRLDQAWGDLPESIAAVPPPEPLVARCDFEHPTSDRGALEEVLRRLVAEIAAQLSAHHLGTQQLKVQMLETPNQHTHFTVGTVSPCRSAAHLLELVKTRLEHFVLQEEVTGIRMEAAFTTPLKVSQHLFFETGVSFSGQSELTQLIDRLSNRLGCRRVVRAVLTPEAQPELAVCWEPWINDPSATSELRTPALFPCWSASARPLRLRMEPLPIEVTSIIPAGPPLRFRYDQHIYTVTRKWGPERIETGWWRGRYVRRDYYRVETECGRRFWLFRRIGRGDWFLHGDFE